MLNVHNNINININMITNNKINHHINMIPKPDMNTTNHNTNNNAGTGINAF